MSIALKATLDNNITGCTMRLCVVHDWKMGACICVLEHNHARRYEKAAIYAFSIKWPHSYGKKDFNMSCDVLKCDGAHLFERHAGQQAHATRSLNSSTAAPHSLNPCHSEIPAAVWHVSYPPPLIQGPAALGWFHDELAVL
jgi:hypothetical protein